MATVLLLVGLSGCTADEPSDTPSASPTSASPSPSTTPTYTPKASLDDLPTGPPPRIAYADRGVIVHPDGRRERLVGQRGIGVSAFTRFRDGWIVADQRWFEGTAGLAYVAGRQRQDLSPCASGGAVLSPDGEQAAWMTQACPESGLVAPTLVHVSAVDGTGEEQREIQRVGIVWVAGFVDRDVVVNDYVRGVQLIGPGGGWRTVPQLDVATAVSSGGLVAGVLEDGWAHGAVLDARTGQLLWQRRHTYLGVFSPDGRLLAGDVRSGQALMDARTGHVVALLRVSVGSVHGWVWEDRRHLLAVAHHRGTQAIVRIDLRGQVTRVGPVVSDDRSYVFETRA